MKMTIEPFGNIEYQSKDKQWFGVVETIAAGNKIELTISVEKSHQDIYRQIERLRQFAADYSAVMAGLYELAFQKYKNTRWEKT